MHRLRLQSHPPHGLQLTLLLKTGRDRDRDRDRERTLLVTMHQPALNSMGFQVSKYKFLRRREVGIVYTGPPFPQREC